MCHLSSPVDAMIPEAWEVCHDELHEATGGPLCLLHKLLCGAAEMLCEASANLCTQILSLRIGAGGAGIG